MGGDGLFAFAEAVLGADWLNGVSMLVGALFRPPRTLWIGLAGMMVEIACL